MTDRFREQFDNWRILPRLMTLAYGYVFLESIHWFMSLPTPNNAQALFISAIIGAAAGFFGFYVNSGNK